MVKKREWLLNGATLLLTVCALFIPDPARAS
jgi:hypothetical protein